MKKQIILLVVVATFACCSVSNASITNAWWQAGSGGAIVCNSWSWNGSDTLTMNGIQSSSPGTMVGWAKTSDPLDPTLFLGSGVDNDTGGAWIGYQVNVYMSVPFTWVGTPSVSTIPVSSWALASTPIAPSGPVAGLYEGTIYFTDGGTPLGIGDELDFNYAIHFASSTDYAFTQEMIPMFAEVPEPGTLGLAAMGGVLLALRLRRNSRQGA